MKFRLGDFQDGVSLAVSQQYAPEKMDVEFDDLHYLEPILLCAEAKRESSSFHLRGQLSSRIEQICVRCLVKVTYTVALPVDLFYDTQDLDEVDTSEDLRELLVLEYDPKFLCRADCKGLCAGCGANLNVEMCSCSTEKLNVFDSLHRVIKNRQRS